MARLEHELLGRGAIGGHDAAKRTHLADVPDKRARIQIPDYGNMVARQIVLRGFRRAPVRREIGKFAHDQGLDVGARRFLILEVCAYVSNVRIRQANDLAGITGIGENFLVTREAGVKNDLAAAARASPGCAPVKNPPILECEDGGTCGRLGQRALRGNASLKKFVR